MKKIFLRIILVIFCITVCNLISLNFFTSKATEVESYGLIIKILDNSEKLEDAAKKIEETYSIDTLKKMCNDFNEDLNNGTAKNKISGYKKSINGDGRAPWPIGELNLDALKSYMNILLQEVNRYEKFNEIMKDTLYIKNGEYSEENKSKLLNYKSYVKSYYTDDYYNTVINFFGKVFWTKISSQGTQATNNKNISETDALCNYIDSAINSLNEILVLLLLSLF